MIRNIRDRQSQYNDYKRRCNEQPPQGLTQCEKWRWQRKRNQDCRDMRQAWDDKWQPGRHVNDIANLARSISRLDFLIECFCKDK
jgi:hypothetical protein